MNTFNILYLHSQGVYVLLEEDILEECILQDSLQLLVHLQGQLQRHSRVLHLKHCWGNFIFIIILPTKLSYTKDDYLEIKFRNQVDNKLRWGVPIFSFKFYLLIHNPSTLNILCFYWIQWNVCQQNVFMYLKCIVKG